ncbi:ATP-binding protein [Methanolobus sp. ZRKC3]|uniref:ATP-binding protein n=1 Tax=Methanolobus sp. ZRKC3 TaxID=3125786 RepID=UPI0032552696
MPEQSEINFKNAVDHLPMAVALLDSQLNTIYVNKRFTDFFGYALSDLSSFDKWWGAVYSDGSAGNELIRFCYDLVKNTDSDELANFPIEGSLRCKDGSVKDIEIHFSKLDDGHNQLLFNDVTKNKAIAARERAYDDLKKEKETAQRYLDIADVMIIATDSAMNLNLINKKGCEVLGYSEAELFGKNPFELCAAEAYRHHYLNYFVQFMKGEIDTLNDVELPALTKSGKERLIRYHVTPISENDEFAGVLVSGNDVTERKMAEKALLLDESRLEALVELNHMVKSTDRQIIHFALEKAVELTGSQVGYIGFVNEDESVLSMHSWSESTKDKCNIDNYQTEYVIEDTGIWGEAIRQGRPIITNNLLDPNPLKKGYPNGHMEIRNHLGAPIFDDDKIVSIVGVGNKGTNYDTSDIRQISLLMEGLWKIIKKRQDETSLKAYAEELTGKNRELASLDIQKDEFLANVTHELKTPLVSIKGYSDLLSEGHLGVLNEGQKKGVDSIVQGSQRLGRLIDSILYLQNVHSGTVEYNTDMIFIKDFIEKLLYDMTLIMGDRVTKIKTNICESLPLIWGNPTYIEQVFFHIIDNALKFTPNTGNIEVSAFPEEGSVHIIVEDSGIGISPEELPHIFKRFYQIDGSRTRRYGGNGLGLHLCKSIIEAHGGNIRAESEEGKGTKIHITLPLAVID